MVRLSENTRGFINLLVIWIAGFGIMGMPKAYTIDALIPYFIVAGGGLLAGLQKWLQEQPTPTLSSEIDEIVRAFVSLSPQERTALIEILTGVAKVGLATPAPSAPPTPT